MSSFFTMYSQDSSNIKKHLNYLGSDLFEGRGTGSIGGELAAKYIAINLNKYELTPMGYENTFYQYIPMHGSKATEDSKIVIVSDKADTLNIKDDFQFYHTGGRIFTPNEISTVFVGYGITADEYEYDDYKNINVEGKVVVYFEGEPSSDNPKYFKGELPTNYSFADTKQKIALSKGAVGTIQIPNYSCKSEIDWEKLTQEYYFEDISLAYLPTPLFSILLNPKSAPKLFNNAKYSFVEIQNMCRNGKCESFELLSKLLLKTKYKRRDFVSPNVVGYLKGSDEKLSNEYIIVSAHYDHLGVGFPVQEDSIYNGVLDNAIGVSALMELAKMFSKNNFYLKRSVIFLFTTGEEKGLLGSSYFIEHSPVSRDKIIANINIDGLAIFGDFNSIVGIGAGLSTLGDILNKVAKQDNLTVENIDDGFDSYESFLRSDQFGFAVSGIPSVLVSDELSLKDYTKDEVIGFWKDYIHNRYHTPFDDLSQIINYAASIKHIRILYNFISELVNIDKEITWKTSSPFQRGTN